MRVPGVIFRIMHVGCHVRHRVNYLVVKDGCTNMKKYSVCASLKFAKALFRLIDAYAEKKTYP